MCFRTEPIVCLFVIESQMLHGGCRITEFDTFLIILSSLFGSLGVTVVLKKLQVVKCNHGNIGNAAGPTAGTLAFCLFSCGLRVHTIPT